MSSLEGMLEIDGLLNNTYRVKELVGRGGTGEVYRVENEVDDEIYAVKVLKAELASQEQFLDLMKREATTLKRIRHDGIVHYYGLDRTAEGVCFLRTDYVAGPSLADLLEEGPVEQGFLLTILRRVADALVAVHKAEALHRDISPDNIILKDAEPEQPILIDFGIARDVRAPGTVVGGGFSGKYEYAPLEQIDGHTDERSDLYSLGVTILAAARGEHAECPTALGAILELKKQHPDVSILTPPLRTIVERMVEPNPEDRVPSAKALVALINEVTAPKPKPAPRTRVRQQPRTRVKQAGAAGGAGNGGGLGQIMGELPTGGGAGGLESDPAGSPERKLRTYLITGAFAIVLGVLIILKLASDTGIQEPDAVVPDDSDTAGIEDDPVTGPDIERPVIATGRSCRFTPPWETAEIIVHEMADPGAYTACRVAEISSRLPSAPVMVMAYMANGSELETIESGDSWRTGSQWGLSILADGNATSDQYVHMVQFWGAGLVRNIFINEKNTIALDSLDVITAGRRHTIVVPDDLPQTDMSIMEGLTWQTNYLSQSQARTSLIPTGTEAILPRKASNEAKRSDYETFVSSEVADEIISHLERTRRKAGEGEYDLTLVIVSDQRLFDKERPLLETADSFLTDFQASIDENPGTISTHLLIFKREGE